MTRKTLVAIAVGCAALAACGGGGGGGGGVNGGVAPGSGIPNSALASSSALVAYLQQLIAATDETSTPVSLGDAVLPTDDSGPPAGI